MTVDGSALDARDVATAAATLRARLTKAGIASAAAEAAWLLEAATGLTRAEQVLERDRRLDDDERARLEAWLRRREAREPLQLVLGTAPFHGLELDVRPGVLVPRPETESLVERVLASLRYVAEPRVHDVGTGCGAIALAIAAARPDAVVSASDVDTTAVLVARANAAALGLPVTVRVSDLLAAHEVAAAVAAAHVLVANPPYLPEGDRGHLPPEVAFDPPEALFAGADGLAVARVLARQAAPLLRPGGMLWLELDPRNAEAFADELAAAGTWREARVEADLNGRRRFVLARR